MGLQHLADVHARGDPQRIQYDIDRRPIFQEGHVCFGHDFGHDSFIAVASGHLIADGKLALGSDIDFDLLDDADIDFITRFGPFHFFVMLHLQIVELLFELSDDLVDLVANGRRIDLDAIVHLGQLAQQGFGDFAVRRDDDFARFGVHDIQRNLFAQQNVAQGLG